MKKLSSLSPAAGSGVPQSWSTTPPAPAALQVPLGPAPTALSLVPGQKRLAGPPSTPARSTAQQQLLSQLAEGEPFPEKLAAAIQAIAGAPISKSGLRDLYAACFPGRGIRINAQAEPDHLAFTITWLDNLGGTVATLRRKLKAQEDGALELYSHAQWVAPEHRGKAIAAQVFAAEVELLKALSPAPSTRLTLWAGGMADPHRRGEAETVGKYVWANFGFDFAEARGGRSSLALNGDKPRCEDDDRQLSDLALLRRQFGRWLASEAEAGRMEPSGLPKLTRMIAKLRHPWALASFAVETEGGRAPLGKRFLLSKLAPRWEGAYFVHDRSGAGPDLGARYVAKHLAQAPERWAEAAAELSRDLASPDPEVQKRALLRAGKEAGPERIGQLQSLAQQQPELSEEIATTILKIEGKWVPPRPAPVYSSAAGLRDPARFEVPAEFKALEGATPEALAAKVGDGERRLATAALDILVALHSDAAPLVVLAAATQLYDRFPEEDDWWARRSAVQGLQRIPEEAGIPALIERSGKEDDINVMVAIHRALEFSESPAAEGPAAALLTRIDQLKAEIERALAEL